MQQGFLRLRHTCCGALSPQCFSCLDLWWVAHTMHRCACCRVVAWEPVPQFRALFSHNLARNQLSHLVEVRHTVVAHPPGSTQVGTGGSSSSLGKLQHWLLKQQHVV